MLTIPIQRNAIEYDLCVVLEDENMERIRAYDPCEVVIAKLGLPWRALRCASVRICFANAEEVKRLVSTQNRAETIKFINEVLARGFAFRPELGDSDGDYQSPRKQ